MTGENMNRAGLRALAKVLRFCDPPRIRCRQAGCEKCAAYEEKWQRSMEITDLEFESQIWGVE